MDARTVAWLAACGLAGYLASACLGPPCPCPEPTPIALGTYVIQRDPGDPIGRVEVRRDRVTIAYRETAHGPAYRARYAVAPGQRPPAKPSRRPPAEVRACERATSLCTADHASGTYLEGNCADAKRECADAKRAGSTP